MILRLFFVCFILLLSLGCANGPESILVRGVGSATIKLADLPTTSEPGNLVWASERLEATGRAAIDAAIERDSLPLAEGLAKVESRQQALDNLRQQIANLAATEDQRLGTFIREKPEAGEQIAQLITSASVSYDVEDALIRAKASLDLWKVAEAIVEAGGGKDVGASSGISMLDRQNIALAEAQRLAMERARTDLLQKLQDVRLEAGTTLGQEAQIRPVLFQRISRFVFDARVVENSRVEGDVWRVVLESDIGEFIQQLNRLLRQES